MARSETKTVTNPILDPSVHDHEEDCSVCARHDHTDHDCPVCFPADGPVNPYCYI